MVVVATFVANTDGSGITQITNNDFDDQEFAISGDGKKVAWSGGVDHPGSKYYGIDDEIFIIGIRYLSFDPNTGSGEIATWGAGRVRFSNVEQFNLTGTRYGDELYGGNSNDTLNGADGNDTIIAGLGNDTLSGDAGADRFVFNTPTDGNDTITDFSVADDTISLSAAGFPSDLTVGAAITAEQFSVGTATDARQRFIYDNSSGALFFDSDGSDAKAQVQIATLSPSLAMTNNNIFVI